MRRNETGRRPRRQSDDELSLEDKLKELRRTGKEKAATMRRRDEDRFMTPGQRKRAQIRRGRERASKEKGSRSREAWST